MLVHPDKLAVILETQVGISFRNVHAAGKQSRPVTDIAWMAELHAARSLDVNLGKIYINKKACNKYMYIDCLSDAEHASCTYGAPLGQ